MLAAFMAKYLRRLLTVWIFIFNPRSALGTLLNVLNWIVFFTSFEHLQITIL
jgi:hypothetical protein